LNLGNHGKNKELEIQEILNMGFLEKADLWSEKIKVAGKCLIRTEAPSLIRAKAEQMGRALG
jgi:hypothetical protein